MPPRYQHQQEVFEMFEKSFPTSSTHQLVQMPAASLVHYFYVPDVEQPKVGMPISLRVASGQGKFNSLSLIHNGWIVCWQSCDEIAIIAAQDCTFNAPRFASLKDSTGVTTCSSTTIADCFKNLAAAEVLVDFDSLGMIQYLGKETKKIEALFWEFLRMQLAENWHKTNEGCLADSFYRPATNISDQVLPLQEKASCSQDPKRSGFQFSGRKIYPDMVLLCRHLTANKGTFVAPGSNVPAGGMSGSWTGMYAKFLVPDELFSEFMVKLYAAVKTGTQKLLWPSGDTIDIHTLKLLNLDQVMQPISAMQQKEVKFAQLRRQMMPNLHIQDPNFEGDTADKIIEGRRIQDKLARPHHCGLKITIAKSFGAHGKQQPYAKGDFDAVYAHLPDMKRFYIIPAFELEKRKYLHCGDCAGKQQFDVYPDGAQRADTWANKYLLEYSRTDVQEKFREVLRSINDQNS